jgi:hypothetical protein
MMGNKSLREVKAEVAALLGQLPGGPKKWLKREIKDANNNPERNVKALEMLLAALEDEARKGKRKKRRNAVGEK